MDGSNGSFGLVSKCGDLPGQEVWMLWSFELRMSYQAAWSVGRYGGGKKASPFEPSRFSHSHVTHEGFRENFALDGDQWNFEPCDHVRRRSILSIITSELVAPESAISVRLRMSSWNVRRLR